MVQARLVFVGLSLTASTFAFSLSVTSFGPRIQARSGLIRIIGEGFGEEVDGSLSLNGQPVHLARWDANVIEFYVPESASLGDGTVRLITSSGRISKAISVTERKLRLGRLQWRFQAADSYVFSRVAVGPDGSLYAMGSYGHLYALSPDGGLKWLRRGSFSGSIDTLADGTVICGGGGGVQAFSPQGVPLWQFALPTAILVGPSVGPDGNIYVVDNNRWGTEFLGAAILSPQGELLWNGGAFYNRGSYFSDEVQFDAHNAYFRSSGDGTSRSTPGLTALRLGGGLRWQQPDIVGYQPAARTSLGGVSAVGTSTLDRFRVDGSRKWSVSLYDFGGYQVRGDVILGADGSTYVLTANRRINAVSATGTIRFSKALSTTPSWLAVTPDGMKLVTQTQSNFGIPAKIAAFSRSGGMLWQSEDLPVENGMTITAFNRITFKSDSSMAYFGTSGPNYANSTANSYIYGVRL